MERYIIREIWHCGIEMAETPTQKFPVNVSQPERPHWVGSLPERPHYFGQNGHTLVKTAT